MTETLPVERDLRRVIGDGDTQPDGEVDGLDDADLVELFRQLVLMRTYDERSVVYHRQGRIGTYAIFWNHEAMQVGAVFALEDDDWIFPSYRESAIGLLRGMPADTILSWWRGHPAGLLAGQRPGRRVERRPVAHQAQRTAWRHLYPVGMPETLDRARSAPDPEVGPVAATIPCTGADTGVSVGLNVVSSRFLAFARGAK